MTDPAPQLPPLDLGMPVQDYLAGYWQKRPLVVRQALPDLQSPLDPDELAGMACEDWIESRIVTGPDGQGRFRLEHGPFEPTRFETIGNRDWTLLIQDADKLHAGVDALLEPFAFLPDWRIDDVMVSFAAPGGSVGPHWDHYDVFLLQAQGRRRWLFDDRPDPAREYHEDADLKLLRAFDPNQSALLEPGDLLYLPPGVPHHGIAEDPCLTCSIGMRAPSLEEIVIDFAEFQARNLGEDARYTDPDLDAPGDPGEIDAMTMARMRALLTDALDIDDSRFRRWLGAFLTRYRLAHDAAPPPEGAPQWRGGPLARNPWTRMAWSRNDGGALLFVSGQHHAASARLASRLCRNKSLSGEELESAISGSEDRRLVQRLVEEGHLMATEDA